MIDWQSLQREFLEIIRKDEGPTKYGSGMITVTFGDPYCFNREGVNVEMGTYDIGNWPRQLLLGPFKTEQEAFEATRDMVEKARIVVEQEISEDYP